MNDGRRVGRVGGWKDREAVKADGKQLFGGGDGRAKRWDFTFSVVVVVLVRTLDSFTLCCC